MKLKTNSLIVKIWIYLSIFSITILSFLWLFQVLFLNKFYEISKVNDLNSTVKHVSKAYDQNRLYEAVDYYSQKNGICVQIIEDNYVTYDSQVFNRGCMTQDVSYKEAFISSLLNEQTYKLENTKFKNEVLIKAIRLSDDTFIFLSSSLQPLDGAVEILTNQLQIVTILVLLLSLIIGYFISKKISHPILKINSSAKKMAEGDYENTLFYIDEDISELNELVKTLNYTNRELGKTETLQRELMANVSHDLKTPLTMIKAYAEMVRDLTYKDKDKREENLNVIIEETDRLNLLVNDIVELSTLKSNATELKIDEFDIVDLTKQITKRFGIMNINFIINCEEEILVRADFKRIEQVMYNLITNAINYTGEDKIVEIEFIKNNDAIRVNVKDTGKGIKSSELPLIWKRYYKVDKKYKREKKGSGIGLSIVEEILKKHKFNYGVESKKGRGTTFWFEIK